MVWLGMFPCWLILKCGRKKRCVTVTGSPVLMSVLKVLYVNTRCSTDPGFNLTEMTIFNRFTPSLPLHHELNTSVSKLSNFRVSPCILFALQLIKKN